MTLGLFMVMSLGFLLAQSPEAVQMTMNLVNDDFLKWAFRGLIMAGCAYLYREHGHQRKQDEEIFKLQNLVNFNHPSKADFEAYQLRQEKKLEDILEKLESADRIVRLLAAKANVDVRI